MDTITESKRNKDGEAAATSTPQAILERLMRWQSAIDSRLQAQMTLLEILEQYLLVELRTYYSEGNVDSYFIGALLEAVLQRTIDQALMAYDEQQDAPYRWPGGADQGFSAERRDAVAQVVEGTASSFVRHYQDYLRRHWEAVGLDASLERLIQQKLEKHLAAVESALQPGQLVGRDVAALRGKIETLQDGWRRMSQLAELATAQERQALDALARSQLPDWLRGLGDAERKRLEVLQEQVAEAQARVDELLDGLGSLKDFARHLVKDYVRHELDMDVEPDSVRVQLQWQTVVGRPLQTYTLTELVAAGPVRPDVISVRLVENGGMLRNQALAPEFVARLLSGLDVSVEYWPALSSRYDRVDLKMAMLDWFGTRLRHGAFVARCAGQITNADYEEVRQSSQEDGIRQVCDVVLPNAMRCADLLLFYREDSPGDASDLLLYAPGKPDGQEWIKLPSLRAVSAEMGLWIESEVGREYLLQQLSPADRGKAREYFIGVMHKPTHWDLGRDPRGPVRGFRACLEAAVLAGLANNLLQVELSDSPAWYRALPLASRQMIRGLNQEFLVHQKVFNEQLEGYEVFMDFAKRTVTQAIAPYMRSKGVEEPVDPATVLIDYRPGLGNDMKVASLLDLAIYGYDDNSGIDHPAKGVRSSIGQDLGQVRSADLGSYIRQAYLGDQYAREIRSKFLDSRAPEYTRRRDAFRYMLLTRMDRDLRIVYGQSVLSDDEYQWLARQVTLLSRWVPGRRRVHSTNLVASEGVMNFTVGGHVVLGVYVFAYFASRSAYWLYTPDAPDGIAFRRYVEFTASVVTQLHGYVLERVALTARDAVRTSLNALAAGSIRVDGVRELNRVVDISAQYDMYIERAITDVQAITTSRAEVIKHQIVKGLLFAAAPVCMVYPPFALLLDVMFIGMTSTQAIDAHRQGDTQEALGHWLAVSWGALFATLGPWMVAKSLGWAIKGLNLLVRPMSLAAQRLRNVTTVAVKESGPAVRGLRFKPSQAVRKTPDDLQLVTDDSIFHGTYRSPPSATQPQSTYYIKNAGKYYQVRKDAYFDGLCLVDARRPGAFYKLPIRRVAEGKWVHNPVGLRGGSDEVRNLGRVRDLREAFPGHVSPDVTRGALQGEAVVARFSEAAADNYLFSLNAQTCVVASLYNPATRMGAVIHFDHNIRALIERSIREVKQRLGGAARNIRATLVGGDWLTGTDIGEPVRLMMRRQGLQPTWDHWSYSSCFGNTYGVALDLRTGVTSVFKTSQDLVERYYTPVLARARLGTDPVSVRARKFMKRVRSEPLMATANGAVRTLQGRPATAAQLALNEFSMVVLS
jgi:hypothetical protein